MAPYGSLLLLGLFVASCTSVWGYHNFNRRRHVCKTKVSSMCDQWFVEVFKCNSKDESSGNNGNETETDDPASEYTFRWSRRPWYSLKWCSKLVIRSVPCIHIIKHCCPGWTKDYYGGCTKRAPSTDCPEECGKGGKCNVLTKKCECSPGYTGERCEQVLCDPVCKNGGMCLSIQGQRRCSCPHAFTGQSCENVRCEQYCYNGGTCVANGTRSQCICRPGFVGVNCKIAVKDGECPALKLVPANHCIRGYVCENDGDCRGSKKCCLSLTCSRGICTEPAENTCIYKGVSHDVFTTFHPDPCTRCTCISPDKNATYGGASCIRQSCPKLSRFQRCKNMEYRGDDQCCPVCADRPKPENYKVPEFTNCREAVTLDLPRRGRRVNIARQNLKAVDMMGRDLEILYSNESFTWVEDELKNFHIVTANATDEWDTAVQCTFVVRIRDPHPPEFLDCPSAIDSKTGVDVTWDPPRAVDNTALSGPPDSDYARGSTFPIGETLVTYTATDVEGNENLCQFIVIVEAPPTRTLPTTTLSFGRNDRVTGDKEDVSHNAYYIGMGVGVAVLILVVAFVILMFTKRRRARPIVQQNIPPNNELPPAYDTVVLPGNPNIYVPMNSKKMYLPKNHVDNPGYSVSDEVVHCDTQNIANQQNIANNNPKF